MLFKLKTVGNPDDTMVTVETGCSNGLGEKQLATISLHHVCEEVKDDPATCHCCGVKEGQIHHYECDMERCPFCGLQLITCGCCYKKLGFDYKEPIWDYSTKSFTPESHPTNGLPKDIYENGLPDDLTEKWHIILEEKGRVPHIQWPNICARCGKLWPEMFIVSDEEWEKYVMIRKRDKMLCLPCYDQIKEWIDRGQSWSDETSSDILDKLGEGILNLQVSKAVLKLIKFGKRFGN